MNGDYRELADAQGMPIRIKLASIVSILGAIMTVGAFIASAGAKSERIDALDKRTIVLEALPTRVSKLEAQFDEILRRLAPIDAKLDRILERRSR